MLQLLSKNTELGIKIVETYNKIKLKYIHEGGMKNLLNLLIPK